MANAVVRLDQIQNAIPVSVRYYVDNTPTEIPNGAFVVIGDLEEGQREVFKATAPTDPAATPATLGSAKLVIIASPEFMPDPSMVNLDQFINPANEISRGYVLKPGNIVSLTAEAFATVPDTTNNILQLNAASSYLLNAVTSATNSKVGEFIGSEVVGSKTYYAIRICE